MRGNNNILAALADAERIMMSCIVVSELDYGFRHGQRYQSNRTQLDEWLAQPFIDFLTVTRDTSLCYGAISSDLRQNSRNIPTNDAWIAAHAREHRATVWTLDSHFSHVDDLEVQGW